MGKAHASPEAYLASLPPERREAIARIRQVINSNLGEGFAEGMQYGMLAWFVPHAVYPPGYHCDPRQPLPFASVASQKNHIGIYLFCIYVDAKIQRAFIEQWKASGKKLDMGKACIRVKDLDGVPLDVLAAFIRGVSVRQFIADYESAVPEHTRRKVMKGSAGSKGASSASTPRRKKPATTSAKPSAAGTALTKRTAKATTGKKPTSPSAKRADRNATRKTAKKAARAS